MTSKPWGYVKHAECALGDVQRNARVDVLACLGLASVFVAQLGALGTETQLPTNIFQTLIFGKDSLLKAFPQHGECSEYGKRTKNPCSDSLQSDMNIACDEAKPVGILECQNYANTRHRHTDSH